MTHIAAVSVPIGVRFGVTHGMLLCFAYLFFGYIGLKLALPPGFASPVFPAAGIAVAAAFSIGIRSLPWIFLGSLLLNIFIGWESSGQISMIGVIAGLLIAIASALQAATGRWVLQRWLQQRQALDNGRDILRLLLASPLICLVSSSLSISSLVFVGAIGTEDWMNNWFAWWVGDLLGILVFLPITLCLIGQPKAFWRKRVLTVALPMLITLPLCVVLYVRTSQWENNIALDPFQQYSEQLRNELYLKLDKQTLLLEQMAALFVIDTQRNISLDEFKHFVAPALQRFPILQALEWAAYVPDAQRKQFIQTQNAKQPLFSIKEKDVTGKPIDAKQREFYYPVTYIVPLKGNEAALGFDLASNPTRLQAINQALISGQMVASASIKLIQEKQDQKGILLIKMVSAGHAEKGVVLSVLRMGDFVEKLVPEVQRHIYLRLTDIDDGQALCNTFPDSTVNSVYRQQFTFGSRNYLLETAPTLSYLQQHRSWQSWGVLAGSLFCISLFGALLLLGTGHTRNMEQQVLSRTKELEDNRTYINAILNNISDGIITIDVHSQIVSYNQAAANLFGHDLRSLMQTPFNRLLTLNFAAQYQQLGNNETLIGQTREVEGIRLNQEVFPLELSFSRMELNDQCFTNIIVRDISERQRIDKLKSEFISTVSHELRTPLTAIRGSLSLLDHGVLGALSERMQPIISIALRNSERLVLLVNDILDMEKIRAGKLEFHFQPVALLPQLSQAICNNQAYAEQYQVTLKVMTENIPDVALNVDEHRLQQVLANLLSNAAKFSPAQGEVALSAQQLGNIIKISVKDHGSGIPEAFKSQIFEQFAQADSSDTRQKGGTGLGLSITKAIVEHMQGTIYFESEMGRGTTFYIELPVWQNPAHPS